MKIEIDTELGILTFDGVKISVELLASLTSRDDIWFRIQRRDDSVLVTEEQREDGSKDSRT